jgi:hypothetical protein
LISWAKQKLTILPWSVTLTLSTADYTYDGQEWDLLVTQISTYSKSLKREASASFKLSLRNVCRDLGLIAPEATLTSY